MDATATGRGATAPAPAPTPPPVRRLTVLHDPVCPLCRHLSGWLSRQRQLVPLEFVAVGSAEARSRFPGLDHAATFREITVVGDGGQVWTGPAAFVTCLWALAEHRPLAHRLSTPAGLPLARGAALAASKYRGARWERIQKTQTRGWGPWPGAAPGRPAAQPDACDGLCSTSD